MTGPILKNINPKWQIMRSIVRWPMPKTRKLGLINLLISLSRIFCDAMANKLNLVRGLFVFSCIFIDLLIKKTNK